MNRTRFASELISEMCSLRITLPKRSWFDRVLKYKLEMMFVMTIENSISNTVVTFYFWFLAEFLFVCFQTHKRETKEELMNDLSDRDFLIKSQFLSLWRKAMTISLLFNIKRKRCFGHNFVQYKWETRKKKRKKTKRKKWLFGSQRVFL